MDGRRCTSCGTENPHDARFCMQCGTGLARSCPSCATDNPPQARFCMSCGAGLDQDAATAGPSGGRTELSAPAPFTEPPLPPDERRMVSVLFADLSGYTSIAENLDPEALKGLVERCLRRLGGEVIAHGGTVDKYIGDNVMALFGAPTAHEDDPERAVRAGLGMQAAMDEINERTSLENGITFALRVGVNTGEVAAGAVGDGYTVIGGAVNVAARLQAAARPGTVTVGERTFRGTRGSIGYSQLDPLTLKGKAEPVPAWEATGPLARPGLTGRHTDSPFVGRDDELDLLQQLYLRVQRESRPHLVTLVGQAGVGKSRLLREAGARLDECETAPTFRKGRSLPYGTGLVYWALGEVIRTEADIHDDDSSDVAWHKLVSSIEALSGAGGGAGPITEEPADRRAALIGRLVGIEAPDGVPVVEVDDPAEMRERFFSAARAFVEGMARRGPLVVAWEDVHWADEGMLDLIEYLGQWVSGPLLMLCLTRDELLERRPNWGGGRRSGTSIFLEPLTSDETRSLVAALVEGDAAGEEVSAVVSRAGGNPLFAEELARRLVESDNGSAEGLPDTVHGLLAARLDALPALERRVIQDAAVVGEQFWAGVLEKLVGVPSQELRGALTALQERDVVRPAPGAGRLEGDREFAFRHVLIRDVAYGMLPKAARFKKHFQVGGIIEARAGDRVDEILPLVAEHYGRAAMIAEEVSVPDSELADLHDRAMRALEAAGDAASAVYAAPEAITRYQAALDLRCSHHPETVARIREKQADLAALLGRSEDAIAGWETALAHREEHGETVRVADLHRKIGAGLWHRGERDLAIERYQAGINLLRDGEPCRELVELYEEAASLYLNTGDNMLAVYASERALRLAERLDEPRAASRAFGVFGRVFARIGDAPKARENLERAVELARGFEQGETIRALLGLGDYLTEIESDNTAGERHYLEALALAQEIGDLPAQVELHANLALIAAHRARWDDAERSTEASRELAEREGLVGKLCFPYGLAGILRWRVGDWAEAERQLRRSYELARDVGWSEIELSVLIGLSMVHRDAGDLHKAVTVLDDALATCERAGLVAQSTQVHSLRATALALVGRDEDARAAAAEAGALADRLPFPAGRAAAGEALGVTAEDPFAGVEQLREAAATWRDLERSGDAARCLLLAAWTLRDADPAGARALAEEGQAELDRIGLSSTLAGPLSSAGVAGETPAA
jgi:class 3 adenylate cyclase/predicted ATPase